MKKRNDGRFRTSYTKDGATKYFYGDTEREARKKKEDYKKLATHKQYDAEPKITMSFSEIAQKWLDSKQMQIKPITHKMYREKVNQLSEVFGNQIITRITVDRLQYFLDVKFKEGLSKSYLKKHFTVLSQIFSYAIFPLQIMESNPCSVLKVSKFAHEGERRSLTEAEIKIIFDIFKNDLMEFNISLDDSLVPFSLYPVMMIFTGLRRSEQVSLEWNDFDFDNNTVSISKSINYENNQPVTYHFLKNGDKKRVIPIPQSISSILKEMFLTVKARKCKLLFSNDGEMLKEHQLKNMWDSFLSRSGLNVTQHMLRHTYATLLFKSGVDVKTAQNFMGHKSLETTLRIYTHLEEETKQKNANLFDQYVQNRFNFGIDVMESSSNLYV